jgi:hypothetical protein
MPAKTLVSSLLLSVVVLGCVGPRPRPRPARNLERPASVVTVAARLKTVLARQDHRATLDFVKAALPEVSDDRTRALCEHAGARAHAALGFHLSALTGYQRAWHQLGPDVDGLGSIVLEDWADEQVRAGQANAAREHYELVLSGTDLTPARRRQVIAALVVAYESTASTTDVARWRSDLGRHAVALVSAARIRLAPVVRPRPGPRERPRPRGNGRIPDNTREILPALLARSHWSARPSGNNYAPMSSIRAITVHHSAMTAPGAGAADAQILLIQSSHQSGRGWADIGYHFLIDPEGGVWEGRPLSRQGAHAGSPSTNTGNIGVCLLGNFELGPVPPRQVEALLDVLDSLTSWFGLSPDAVQPHNYFKSSTLCPGEQLKPIVASYRGESFSTLSRQ